jgi:hypothetical protein
MSRAVFGATGAPSDAELITSIERIRQQAFDDGYELGVQAAAERLLPVLTELEALLARVVAADLGRRLS